VLCVGARAIARLEPACRCCSILGGPSTFWGRGCALGERWKRVKERSERNTNLAVFVRFANVEERASAALVLFTAHDGVHRT
jgi:hypothetical protein